MPLQFLLDENVDVRLARFIIEKGHRVLTCEKGISDREIADIARRESAILLTNDQDFSDPFLYPPKTFFGIVLFRLHPSSLVKLTTALEKLLSRITPTEFAGGLFIVDAEGMEIRR